MVTTTCPYCGVGCGLDLHIKDDYIYRVTSDFNNVVNQGNLCVKGRFGYDYIYSDRRITSPMIRKQPQEAGKRVQAFDIEQWVEVSWDEALDYVAKRLVKIHQRDGANALAVYCCAKASNEDNYLLQKLFRSVFLTNNVDHCTRLCHAGSVVALQMAIGSAAMSNTAAEVIKSDCFVVTGSNTPENHPIIALQMKAAVEKHGAKLIVIDPRKLELCDYAALWLPLKPGTNVPVFTAMANVIINEGLINTKFVADRTEGFSEFKKSVQEFTPEYAESEETGERWARTYYGLMSTGTFMPNSPTLMNAGREMGMLSACFVLPVEDSIDQIFNTLRHVALIQKAGGGTGFSFSRLRPDGDIVASSGGRTSGPMAFIDAFSAGTEAIQQGAFRRGANMGVMRCDHPDVVEFVQAKDDLSRWTNYNVSVAVTNEWMQSVVDQPDEKLTVSNPRNGQKGWLKKDEGRRVSSVDYEGFAAGEVDPGCAYWTYQEVMDLIVHFAWKNGEPGMLFLDHAEEDNMVPNLGAYEATNP